MIVPLLWVAAVPAPASAPPPPPDPAAEVAAFRRSREARLRAPDGWLALVGLAWLHPGANSFGGAPDDEVRMPPSVRAHAGTLLVDGKTVRAAIAAGVPATLNGRRIEGRGPIALRSDAGEAPPDVVGLGSVTLQVIDRGGRLGARVKDPDSPARKAFHGLAYFPMAPAYRVAARLVPAPGGAGGETTKIVVDDATGGRQELESPGTLRFTLLGRALTLAPVRDGSDDGDLLVVFRDATSGRETYGAGRFVRARRGPDGGWTLDFNQAYTPPCAFTPYATCPLPPPENRLPLAIPAGEKTPPGTGHDGPALR